MGGHTAARVTRGDVLRSLGVMEGDSGWMLLDRPDERVLNLTLDSGLGVCPHGVPRMAPRLNIGGFDLRGIRQGTYYQKKRRNRMHYAYEGGLSVIIA